MDNWQTLLMSYGIGAAQIVRATSRHLENMAIAVSPAIAATLPERAQELLGYGIHPHFWGYVDGMHPARVLATN